MPCKFRLGYLAAGFFLWAWPQPLLQQTEEKGSRDGIYMVMVAGAGACRPGTKVPRGISRSLWLTSQQFVPSPWPACTPGVGGEPITGYCSTPGVPPTFPFTRSKFAQRKLSRASRSCQPVLKRETEAMFILSPGTSDGVFTVPSGYLKTRSPLKLSRAGSIKLFK